MTSELWALFAIRPVNFGGAVLLLVMKGKIMAVDVVDLALELERSKRKRKGGMMRIAKGTGTTAPELTRASVRKECAFVVDDTYTAIVTLFNGGLPSLVCGASECNPVVEWEKNGRRVPYNRPTPPELAKMEAELKRLALAQWNTM